MKALKILTMIMMVAAISCEKKIENGPDTQAEKSDIDIGMPGNVIQDVVIDNNNQLYFVTYKLYYTLGAPEESWQRRYYLSRKTDETGEFEILDSNFVQVDKIIFDKDNNLWGINEEGLFLRKNTTCDTIIKLGRGGGIFYDFAVDENNNIWAGGPFTGLYKVDQFLNITKYTTENSVLTTNGISYIHIDGSNNLWVGLYKSYGPYGLLRIAENNWTIYTLPGTKDQQIFSLVTDKNGDLWIGKGHPYYSETLVRFNGDIWETINPMNDKGELVVGVVRQLLSDTKRLFVVVEINKTINNFQLLTFDGVKWNQILGLPEPIIVGSLNSKNPLKLTIDNYRQVLWINLGNKGIYKLDL